MRWKQSPCSANRWSRLKEIWTISNISDELGKAGYSAAETTYINQQIKNYLNLREIIRNAAAENLDLKAYEADMRHLIDTYIEADAPRKISPFDNMPLLDLIVNTGIANSINSLPDGLKGIKNIHLSVHPPAGRVRISAPKRMKTRWGSCNYRSNNIRLNTELAKKPPECLEYVVVHEMAHLLERHITAGLLH